jgi:hypothetical protein
VRRLNIDQGSAAAGEAMSHTSSSERASERENTRFMTLDSYRVWLD